MLNFCSSTLPSFNTLDTLISNTANAYVTMSANLITFTSFFWYSLVSTISTPLTLTPARETAPKGILTGRPMSVLNIARLDIPEATLRPLEQAMSVNLRPWRIFHVSSHTFLLALATAVAYIESCSGGRIVGLRELKWEELDTTFSLSFFLRAL